MAPSRRSPTARTFFGKHLATSLPPLVPNIVMNPPYPHRTAAGGKMRSQLLDAAIDGDIGSFNRFARALHKGRGHLRDTVEGVRTEDEDTRGLGALHLAAGSGKLDMCPYLVEVLGVDVDAVDHGGRTPLIQAIYNEKVNTAKYLLDQGANQDKTSDDGFTPLHCAAGLGFYKIVRQLLERGAYPDPVNGCGTPLHIVAAECDDRSMKILLDHNADYNKMLNGMTPLYFAINATSVKCVSSWLRYCNFNLLFSVAKITMRLFALFYHSIYEVSKLLLYLVYELPCADTPPICYTVAYNVYPIS
ncbi:ankyrin repeat protein nuc-2-like [Lolium perenne]|uniref:ankyrin repeat protein nuc-2-like n=1 Tax=Lolium perenne TaxID=4522 RepID=UPI003A9A1007